jgi:hypothetical protein
VVFVAGVGVGLNIGSDQKGFIAFHLNKGLLNGGFSTSERFDLCAQKADSGLENVENLVFVPRFLVASDNVDGL